MQIDFTLGPLQNESNLTSELTRRCESKQPAPHQARCARRYRRSRPMVRWKSGLQIRVQAADVSAG